MAIQIPSIEVVRGLRTSKTHVIRSNPASALIVYIEVPRVCHRASFEDSSTFASIVVGRRRAISSSVSSYLQVRQAFLRWPPPSTIFLVSAIFAMAITTGVAVRKRTRARRAVRSEACNKTVNDAENVEEYPFLASFEFPNNAFGARHQLSGNHRGCRRRARGGNLGTIDVVVGIE